MIFQPLFWMVIGGLVGWGIRSIWADEQARRAHNEKIGAMIKAHDDAARIWKGVVDERDARIKLLQHPSEHDDMVFALEQAMGLLQQRRGS